MAYVRVQPRTSVRALSSVYVRLYTGWARENRTFRYSGAWNRSNGNLTSEILRFMENRTKLDSTVPLEFLFSLANELFIVKFWWQRVCWSISLQNNWKDYCCAQRSYAYKIIRFLLSNWSNDIESISCPWKSVFIIIYLLRAEEKSLDFANSY